MARTPKAPRRPRKADIKAAADRAEARTKGEELETPKVDIDPEIIPATDIASKMGRPPKYRTEYARIAQALCRRGATDAELAEEFEVSTSTIWRWSCKYEDFWNAIHVEKAKFDERVERSLAQRAVGYSYNTEKVFQYQGQIVRAKVLEHVPPDVSAAKMWLMNRKPKEWREAVQRVENGLPGDFTDNMTDAELQEYIAAESKAILSRGAGSGKGSKTRH